ncbi:sensor histidine kinase [Oceanobacillus picturae]|uniref:sensor histidine kinase n=1 Tax=Oceanobacillus picturae TaxID=171693 RepID=UPI000E69DC14|nr:HAMP domain-containing sensor histidine kinase [Oceanobacillus picturae]RIU91416.1 sensor histidine kinase [Oceanobacillus picturae]
MWGWIFVFLALSLLLYIIFLKREQRRLIQRVREISIDSSFGSRLFLDFREKTLLDLVDELNHMIDEYEEKNRQAIQMEENVKLSIAGLSHDLRTPLTSIKGYVQLLHASTDEVNRANYLKIIEHSITRLMEMTDHFYDLARIETNQKEIALSTFSLSKLVEETFLDFYDQLEKKQIEVQFPEEIYEQKIIADRIMLIRIIQNVIQNILRYAKSKTIIDYNMKENHLILTIQNDIKTDSKVAIEKVFIRFYTEITSRTNTESSGLGLYLSKKLVKKMNGKIDAELHDGWFILKIHLPINRNST